MEVNQNYVKFTQLYELLQYYHDESAPSMKAILNSGYDINYAEESTGCTLLHYATEAVDEEYEESVVIDLLSCGADYTLQTKEGQTPLRYVFRDLTEYYSLHRQKVIVQRLLEVQVKSRNTVNPRCKDGISHFHIACMSENLNAAKFFLEAGVPVNEPINSDSDVFAGYTPLHISVKNRDKDMVQLLLKYGADLDCLNAYNESPLHLLNDKFKPDYLNDTLSKKSTPEMNDYLLSLILVLCRDDFNLLDYFGLTQIHVHCIRKFNANNFSNLEKLLINCTNVNTATNHNTPFWAIYSPLHFAAINHNLRMILLLLKYGADRMAKDTDGNSPLDICLDLCSPSELSQILKTQSDLGSIKFQNGVILAEILSAYDDPAKLLDYWAITNDINTVITRDSPLWPGFTYLHLAVYFSRRQDTSRIALCLAHEADITIKDAKGMTALHLAFEMQKTKCVDAILKAHTSSKMISINPVDNDNLSHFHIACIACNKKAAEKFLRDGVADPNKPTRANKCVRYFVKSTYGSMHVEIPANSTPLHIAIATQSENMIDLLLEYGADPCIQDADGLTYIHRSFVNRGYLSFKPVIWRRPASAQEWTVMGPGGLSYLHVACAIGDLDAVETALTFTTNINEPLGSDYSKFMNSFVGNTPMHLAVRAGSKEIVKMLLENGANVEMKNIMNRYPLHEALNEISGIENEPVYLEIAKILALEFDKRGLWPADFGMTRLHVACMLNDVTLMRKLLVNGEDFNRLADLNSPIQTHETPLHAMVHYKYTPEIDEAVKLLLNCFLNSLENSSPFAEELHELEKRRKLSPSLSKTLTIHSEKELTAFHVSCMGYDSAIVEKFLDFGVDVNEPSNYSHGYGTTPLHFAVQSGSESVIEILLRRGANINIQNTYGYTPVHQAAEEHSYKLAIFLRLCEVDIEMKTAHGETLMDILFKNENAQSDEFLNFLILGAAKNFDFPTKIRFVKRFAQKFSRLQFRSLIEHIPDLTDVDFNQCNVIHHLVFPPKDGSNDMSITSEEFADNIEILVKSGCNLNHRDVEGKTPLHYAVLSKNPKVTIALMLAGANVNVADINGETPLLYCKETQDMPLDISRALNRNVQTFLTAGLNVNPANIECSREYEEEDILMHLVTQLDEMKSREICKCISVRSLLTEEIVMKFPVMPLDQRQLILKKLEADDLHSEFFMWSPLFKLQQQRITRREKLLELAMISLRLSLDQRLPDHCLESILTRLSNEDIQNLIFAKNKPKVF